ncbi:hypothetical protein [Mycobacterium sp. ACS4331]|uniref:hypothetical protein n=1 Tax=Mycobacterium sp. ACS4331 TaxID=1834121 RepID=UPI000801119F|nr:hypothetical protein [Mycobacterium sp. ACS4331]OBF15700.1 hypothetical protein A5727_14855 [Mycobacterium sp. ACS4331]
MLTAVAIIPSAPVLVPQLAGAAADELVEARDAVLACAAALPDQWVCVGAAAADAVVGPDAVGTLAGYGVDVRVTLGPVSTGPLTELPLCALISGWVRAQVAPQASAHVHCVAATRDAAAALNLGADLRADIERSDARIGVLVVADGLTTLTPSAPGGHDPDSVATQAALDDALAAGDAEALAALPDGVVGRVAYQVLAGLLPRPRRAQERYRGAPYGVGYFAGVWRP